MEGPNLPWITLYLFLYKFPTIFCQEYSTFLHVLSSILPRTDSEDYPENTVESKQPESKEQSSSVRFGKLVALDEVKKKHKYGKS